MIRKRKNWIVKRNRKEDKIRKETRKQARKTKIETRKQQF